MKQLNIAGLIILILISTASFAFAKFSVEPSVSIRETYNDNVFLADSGEEDDFITTVTPRVNLEYAPNESFDLTLDWGLNFRYYSDHKKLNDLDLDKIFDIDLKAHARPSSRVYIDATDTFKRVPIDVRRKTAEDNFSTNKTDKNIFTISPYTVLPLTTTLTTTIGYKYNNTWYRGSDGMDSESHSGYVTLNKRFTTKINGEVKYDYLIYRPDTIGGTKDEYQRHQPSVAATYQIRPEFSVNGEVGEAWFDYENLDDVHTPFWNIGTTYKLKMAPDTSLTAKYGTSFHDAATTDGVYKSRRLDLDFESGREFKISIKPYHSVDKYLNIDRKDVLIGVVADISRPVTERLTLKVNGTEENQKFLPEDDKVNKYSIGPSLDYKVSKNITTGIGYRYSGYKKRTSDHVTDKYRNSTVWLQAKVTF